MGMISGLDEIEHVKSLAGPGTWSKLVSLSCLPETQVRAPQQGLGWPCLMSFFPPVFKLGSLPVARECIPKHSCLPAQAPGCWELAVAFMELMCVSGCARLSKHFDENAFVLKSSINMEGRPGRGVSNILAVSAVIKGSGQRENGNGGDSPVQWLQNKGDFLFLALLSWILVLDCSRPISPFLCPEPWKSDFRYPLKELLIMHSSLHPTPTSSSPWWAVWKVTLLPPHKFYLFPCPSKELPSIHLHFINYPLISDKCTRNYGR